MPGTRHSHHAPSVRAGIFDIESQPGPCFYKVQAYRNANLQRKASCARAA